jgi:hypothetical protein
MPVMKAQDVARNLLLVARTLAKLNDSSVSEVLLTLVLELAAEDKEGD